MDFLTYVVGVWLLDVIYDNKKHATATLDE
jgi:hypothetical protein